MASIRLRSASIYARAKAASFSGPSGMA